MSHMLFHSVRPTPWRNAYTLTYKQLKLKLEEIVFSHQNHMCFTIWMFQIEFQAKNWISL